MNDKIKVLFAGETWLVLKMHIKGFDMIPLGGFDNFGIWFVEALSEFKEEIEVNHMPNHVVLTSFPRTQEEINQYDVVVLSDCGKNTLQLYPDMFSIPMGPDRLEVIKEFVENGKSFIMAGGWGSYQGIRGIAGYHETAIEEILPVEIQPVDDRVEKPQGVRPEILDKSHPLFKGLPEEWPLFVGYNKVLPKKDSELLANINGDPFIAVRDYKKGKTMAFTSDLSKHWGTGFVNWEGYKNFWYNTLRWMTGR